MLPILDAACPQEKFPNFDDLQSKCLLYENNKIYIKAKL